MSLPESAFPDPPIPTFDTSGFMIPPWIKYPAIPRSSIGWRMGEGEAYWDDFREWWKAQLPHDQANLRNSYPEPPEWSGFFKDV